MLIKEDIKSLKHNPPVLDRILLKNLGVIDLKMDFKHYFWQDQVLLPDSTNQEA